MRNREEILNIVSQSLQKQGAKEIAVFGSYARNEEQPDSDLDILVKFSEKKGLLELVGIEQELSDQLQIKVDLLTEKSISPYIIDHVKNEMLILFDEKR